jgi:hypothetical protein
MLICFRASLEMTCEVVSYVLPLSHHPAFDWSSSWTSDGDRCKFLDIIKSHQRGYLFPHTATTWLVTDMRR